MTVNELIFQREGEILGRLVDVQERLEIMALLGRSELFILAILVLLVVTIHLRRL